MSTAMIGTRLSTNQTGCVHNCNRLMKVMPCVTSGTTTTAHRMYPSHSGTPKKVCSIDARMTASMPKKMKVKEA